VFLSRFHLPVPLAPRSLPASQLLRDSDSCPAPSGTRTGLLDYRVCISRHSVSNHPMRPVFRRCSLLRAGLASDLLCVAIGGSSDFALCSQSRQSHKAVSSLCRGPFWPSVLRTVLWFPVALHTASPRCSYFQLVAGSTATEGLPPSYARSFSSARARSSRPHPPASRRRNSPCQAGAPCA